MNIKYLCIKRLTGVVVFSALIPLVTTAYGGSSPNGFGGLLDSRSLLNPDWPSANHDYANSANNLLEYQLSPKSIVNQGLSKQYIGSVTGQATVAPVIYNGIAYYADLKGNVYGVNTSTGKLLFNTHVSDAIYYLGYQLDNPNHAVQAFFAVPTVTDKYVFAADTEGVLYKLDRFTGTLLGSVATSSTLTNSMYTMGDFFPNAFNPAQNYYHAAIRTQSALGCLTAINRSDEGKPPLITYGLSAAHEEYYVAMAYEPTAGAVVGVNAETMQIEWKTLTTSPQKWGSGNSVWSSPAIDTKRHLLFIGTGQYHSPGVINPTPDSTPDYSDSLIAINYDTGNIVDYVQFTKGDIWGPCYSPGSSFCDPSQNPPAVFLNSLPTPVNWTGYTNYLNQSHDILGREPGKYQPLQNDVASPPQLFTIVVQGKPHDVVGVNDKDGTYFVVDRANLNKIYWATPSVGATNGTFDLLTGGGQTQGGAAIDYAHRLIWEVTSGIDFQGVFHSFLQAMDMDSGTIKYSLKLPEDPQYGSQVLGTVSIANNVLYVPQNYFIDPYYNFSGTLLMYDISSCSDATHQPVLIKADTVQMDSTGTVPLGLTRNVSIVNGKIFAVTGFYDPVSDGGLTIYSLNKPYKQ